MFVIECGKRVFQRVAALTRLLARILSWMQRAIRDGTPGTAERLSWDIPNQNKCGVRPAMDTLVHDS